MGQYLKRNGVNLAKNLMRYKIGYSKRMENGRKTAMDSKQILDLGAYWSA